MTRGDHERADSGRERDHAPDDAATSDLVVLRCDRCGDVFPHSGGDARCPSCGGRDHSVAAEPLL